MKHPTERTPVIVGIGERTDRPADPAQGLHPLQLMEASIRAADTDAGGGWLARVDSLDIVNQLSWPYLDIEQQLGRQLGLKQGARVVYGPVGGESPVRDLHEAALAILEGRSEAALVCGGEAQSTVIKAAGSGVKLAWPPRDPAWAYPSIDHECRDEMMRYGLRAPAEVYPLYENATRAAWKQSFDEAQAESAAIWAQFSQVAANNPQAWIPRVHEAQTIRRFDEQNRPIAWPYGKLMVANNMVNQSAALLLTSLGAARAAGVAEQAMVFVWDGCSANEPRSVLHRDDYTQSPAQDTVLRMTLERTRLRAQELDLIELYSCFPCVPKMARRSLGLGLDQGPFTVAGGLTFFGSPMNAYMLHAATAMVRALRSRLGRTGLLYGQGEFVTKHHALVLSNASPPEGVRTQAHSVQAEADRRRGTVPAFVSAHEGEGRVESYTVFFERSGQARDGVVVARNAHKQRFLARLPAQNPELLRRFTDPAWEPVGSRGRTTAGAKGLMEWSVSE